MPATSSADHTNVPAQTPSTSSTLVAATSTPPSAGPTKIETLSIVLEVTFVAVSSSGSVASSGSSADFAGSNAVPTTFLSDEASSTTISGAPTSTSSALHATMTARSTSLTTITRTRGKRSPSVDANGAATAAGPSARTTCNATPDTPACWNE